MNWNGHQHRTTRGIVSHEHDGPVAPGPLEALGAHLHCACGRVFASKKGHSLHRLSRGNPYHAQYHDVVLLPGKP